MTETSPALPSAPAPRRALRDPDDRLLGGVASGLAEHLGLQSLQVRLGFVVLALFGGFGVLVYGALWVLLPVRDPSILDARLPPGVAAARRQGRGGDGRADRRSDVTVALSLAIAGLGFLVLVQGAGLGISPRVFWPLLVGAAGLVLLWWQADEATRSAWMSPVRGRQAWLRIAVGLLLLVAAILIVVLQTGRSGTLGEALGLVLLIGVGAALVVGPWLIRARREVLAEHNARVRSQERADVAAHLHDSVLQTLALIQRQADDPQAVGRLARRQERELRSWLFEPSAVADDGLRAALTSAAQEIEDDHEVRVDVVVVGDLPVSDEASALVAAAREAMVNAAKHSGSAQVDVYAEVTPEQVEVFVRDRGRGFDPRSIAADRQGIRQSIEARMRRYGGVGEVVAGPGSGTEVRLRLPRPAAGRQRTAHGPAGRWEGG
ncbi:MAG TPA: PspC domain-containing protein [Nocardioidaceae bacterium]|nr:PspC domain-containing protein [Nocardioidaceae bacterium]